MIDQEVIDILKRLDVEASERRAFMATGIVTSSRRNTLAGMHKARVLYGSAFTEDEINESKNWLDQNGFKRTIGGMQ